MKWTMDKDVFFGFTAISFLSIVFIGCVSFESTLATNVDMESNTYELTMGYNKEDAFNLLAFGNVGFLFEGDNSFTYSFGLEYEHYFTDIVGLSGRVGYKYKEHEVQIPYYTNYGYYSYTNYDYQKISENGILLQLGVPFSWSYGKITPFIGVIFYDNPRFNIGISFALRNQAAAITLIALGASGQQWDETGRVYDSRGRHIASIYTRDKDQERRNQEVVAENISGIMGMPVEDKKPYPAWKWRPEYEGIYWEYVED